MSRCSILHLLGRSESQHERPSACRHYRERRRPRLDVCNRLSLEDALTRGPELAEGRVTAIAACRTCGTGPLENARFCHGFGSPVQDGDIHAEYKQVTVLFAELVIPLGVTY